MTFDGARAFFVGDFVTPKASLIIILLLLIPAMINRV